MLEKLNLRMNEIQFLNEFRNYNGVNWLIEDKAKDAFNKISDSNWAT